MPSDAPARIRVDKWLWHARFAKSRSVAADLVTGGHVRINGRKVGKPAQPVGPGDVLTLAVGDRVWVVRMLTPGQRRGPASEAQTLYEDLTEPVPAAGSTDTQVSGGPRPTKRDRRKIDAARPRELE